MLHIILLILKAVGILLAAVLLLLLLCILLLLFVPLRYEIAFRHTETETAIQGKVSWLLHLIRAKLFYEKPEGKGLLVKIGSFQLIPKKEETKAGEESKAGLKTGGKISTKVCTAGAKTCTTAGKNRRNTGKSTKAGRAGQTGKSAGEACAACFGGRSQGKAAGREHSGTAVSFRTGTDPEEVPPLCPGREASRHSGFFQKALGDISGRRPAVEASGGETSETFSFPVGTESEAFSLY